MQRLPVGYDKQSNQNKKGRIKIRPAQMCSMKTIIPNYGLIAKPDGGLA
jgi:hypothetical protein